QGTLGASETLLPRRPSWTVARRAHAGADRPHCGSAWPDHAALRLSSAELSGCGRDMGKIVWLASYPKSGNTWLRAFLHNLLRDPPAGYDINSMADFTLGASGGNGYAPFIGRSPCDGTFIEIGKVRRKAHEAMTKAYPDNVFVKTHNAHVVDP